MNRHRGVAVMGAVVLGGLVAGSAGAGEEKGVVRLATARTELLRLEPILVTVKIEGEAELGLPAALGGESAAEMFGFEIEPAVKTRPKARPLPLEAKTALASARTYDLLEWYQFPDRGEFTVRAVFMHAGTRYASDPVRLTIRKPAKGDAEFDAVARVHHIPWSNYDTNAFCGDTFDVVKRWPESKLAKYCHYWNGRYSQNKDEFDKAIASYETVLKQYPDFEFADAARLGLEECKTAASRK
jgi:hypothetical protein